MAKNADTSIMAIFCDFENVAIGANESKYPPFDISKVLERLLVKGNIVVKKAYCDWSRYQTFKPSMHEAAFELIDIPHLRQSGKNSADIRMVVDALDLCYTKLHVDTFVVISGDSDFSPLVSKLRENNKTVIGVGVKNSSSDLFISNCDEFIFYDDLVRDERSRSRKRPPRQRAPKADPTAPAASDGDRKDEAVDLVLETIEKLIDARSEEDVIWSSMVKQAIKRRNPGFNERFYGFRSFGALIEEVEKRGLIKLKADERSGGYIITLVANGDGS